jgi:hypothetical protein
VKTEDIQPTLKPISSDNIGNTLIITPACFRIFHLTFESYIKNSFNSLDLFVCVAQNLPPSLFCNLKPNSSNNELDEAQKTAVSCEKQRNCATHNIFEFTVTFLWRCSERLRLPLSAILGDVVAVQTRSFNRDTLSRKMRHTV